MGSLPTFYSVLALSMYLAEYLTSYKLSMSPQMHAEPLPQCDCVCFGG